MNYRIKTIISALCFFSVFSAKAQNYDLYNIKLKSGLILKCDLVSISPDSFVTVRQYGELSRIKCSEILWIEHAGVKKIDSAHHIKKRPTVIFRNLPDSAWTCGFRFGPGLNFGGPDAYSGFPSIGSQLRFCAFKGLGKRWEAGFSLGFDGYAGNFEWLFANAAAEVRLHVFKEKSKSPFIYAQGGYGLNLTEVNIGKSGGANLALGFGQSSRTRKQDIFSLLVGLKVQNGKSEPVWRSRGTALQFYSLVGAEIRLEWRF